MFVDPKITLTRRVTDPAGTIRKARVLLDQHLRQDAAYNRQVSRSLYFIGPDVTCQITHEFNQTYIALDQKAQPEPVAAVQHQKYEFMSVLVGDYTDQALDGIGGYAYISAWLSPNETAWLPQAIDPILAQSLQFGQWAMTRVSQSQEFILGQLPPFPSEYKASWALFNPRSLTMQTPQYFPLLNGLQITRTGSVVYVGKTVVCFVAATPVSGSLYLVYFDYTTNSYLYYVSLVELLALSTDLSSVYESYLLATLAALTRSASESYAQVAFLAPVNNVIGVWITDVNAGTHNYFGGIPISYSSQNQLVWAAPGGNAQLAVSYPSATNTDSTTQAGTDFWILNPTKSTAYTTIQFGATAMGLGYTPLGWFANFEGNLGDLYFFSGSGVLGAVTRNISTPYLGMQSTPTGVFDAIGGDLYQSVGQKVAQPRGTPPYSNPNNPAYALDTPGLLTHSWYLGADFAPWLNLY